MRSRGVFFVIIGFVGIALFGNSAVAGALAQPLPGPTPVPVPIATATGSPNPDVSPIGTPSAAASPTASPTPLAVPIVLDRVRVGIVPGTTVTVSVSGGTGTIGVRASAPNVDVAYDPVAGKASLTGRAPGRATVTVFDDAGDTANVDVLVAPPAGVVPSDVTVELGGNVAPDFAVAKIQEAIAANAQLRPGTHVDVHGAQPSNALHAGDVFEATARVHVDGANAYVDVNGATNVHLRVESFAQLNPELLDYSDDPESLERGIEGVLYRNELDAAKPARAYVYHISSNSSHDLYLVLRSSANEAHVQLIGSASGPSNAFGYVGHLSTLRYFLQRGAQESNVVDVTPDTPYVLRLGTRELHSQELVAGIFDARVLDGGPVELSVIGASLGTDPLSYAGLPEHAGDGHGRRGEFDLTAVPPMALTYVAGAPDPPPFVIGVPTIPNLRAGGRALGGDYGALREVSLSVSNPATVPANVFLYEVAAGGSATTTIWFTGDPAPTEIPCVIRPNRYAIKGIALAPGESRVVTGEYMTDGTSSFPLQFGLTSTPPSPPPGPYSPDACNPHTPPPATPAATPPTSPTTSPTP